MAEYINKEEYCENYCRCSNEHCDRQSFPIWKAPAADVAPVRRGRWIFTNRYLWYKDENGDIDEWKLDYDFHNGPEGQICHEAFCEYCTPGWSDTKCEIGHYYCSECMETSVDAHENDCPNCGAKMEVAND